MTKADDDRFPIDDPKSHQSPQEQAAWVRWVAAGRSGDPSAAVSSWTAKADMLLVEMRKRDRTYDGEV